MSGRAWNALSYLLVITVALPSLSPSRCVWPVAVVFGCVLLLLGVLMIWRKLWEQHEQSLARILVLAFSTLVLLSGCSCFLLEVIAALQPPLSRRIATPVRPLFARSASSHLRRAVLPPRPARSHQACRAPRSQKDWFKRIPPKAKVPMYMALGISLCFAVSFSVVDLINLYADRCGKTRMPLVSSSAQIFLVLAGAVAMGAAFGLIFGVMDVEDDISRRVPSNCTACRRDPCAASRRLGPARHDPHPLPRDALRCHW